MNRLIVIIVLIVLAGFLFSSIKLDYGAVRPGIYEYYTTEGLADTGALNLVTAIYLDYRVYDTLGEATVFFASALGVYMLLRKLRKGDQDG